MQISKVACSLKLGIILNKKQLGFVYFCAVLVLILIGFTFVPYFKEELNSPYEILAIILFDIAGVFLIVLLGYVIIKNYFLKKKVLKYFNDSVALRAYCETVERGDLSNRIYGIKILVKFKFNGKKIKQVSSAKAFGAPKGFGAVYKKYADREIKILYSQKYDDVLILKD